MKKSTLSKTTTWIIRILLFIVIVIGISLFMLSTIGGTSDSHRKGLEQALSDSLGADVKIGSLEEFNIMPQLVMKAGDVHGVFRDTRNEFLADYVVIAFGLTDLITGRRRIEDFQLDRFRFSADSNYDLQVEHAGIESGRSPRLIAKGDFSRSPFALSMPVLQDQAARPGYFFAPENSISGHYGQIRLKGVLVPTSGDKVAILQKIEITSDGKTVATGEGKRTPSGFQIRLDCGGDGAAQAKSDLLKLKTLSFIVLADNCSR